MIVPGGEILTGALDLISQSLTIPVLIILLVIFLLALITIGATIAASAQLLLGTLAELLPKIPITA